MNDRHIEQVLDAWLDAGPAVAPSRVTEAARLEIRSTRQSAALRGWPPLRFPIMNNTMRIALATAVVAVTALLGFNYIVAPNIGSPGLGDPTPTPTPVPAIFDDQPNGENLAPGSYLITEIEPFRITITVPGGWQNVRVPGLVWGEGAVLGFWKVDNLFVDPCIAASGLLDPAAGPTVEDLVTAFSTVPGVVLTTPTDVTVVGFAGKQIDLRFGGGDSCIGEEPVLWPIGAGSDAKPAPAPGDVERLWILDVNGDRLVITSSATAGATDEVLAELDAIFESIRIEAP
jgi:hypothetical protein